MFLDASKFTETSRIVAIDDEFGNDISEDEQSERSKKKSTTKIEINLGEL